jgi:nitroreductase
MNQLNRDTLHEAGAVVSVLDAIYARRAVRSFTRDVVERQTVTELLTAAVQAPNAMHEETWAFAVIQDYAVLKRLSDTAKKLAAETAAKEYLAPSPLIPANSDVFHGAGTLIVIYCKHAGAFVEADCWLAAQNLLLAAYAMGLGSCVIGYAVAALNTPEWKDELRIPAAMSACAPIIIGFAAGVTVPTSRKAPEILIWK